MFSEHDAFVVAREITEADLLEMGFTSISDRAAARLLLAEAAQETSDANLAKQWAVEEHWSGQRRVEITCGFFPCCLCVYGLRRCLQDAEWYRLTNVSLEVIVNSGVFHKTKHVAHIFLRNITSVSSSEMQPLTGTTALCGVKLMKTNCFLHINTELGTRISIRCKRLDVEAVIDEIMVRVVAAVSIKLP
jgi:hypothetical protein